MTSKNIITFVCIALATLVLFQQSTALPNTSGDPLQVASTYLEMDDCKMFANRRRLLHNSAPYSADSTDTCYEMLTDVVVTPSGNYRRQDWDALKSLLSEKSPIVANVVSMMPVTIGE